MGGRQDTAFLKGPYFKKNDNNGGVLQKMRVGGFDHPIRGRQKKYLLKHYRTEVHYIYTVAIFHLCSSSSMMTR